MVPSKLTFSVNYRSVVLKVRSGLLIEAHTIIHCLMLHVGKVKVNVK